MTARDLLTQARERAEALRQAQYQRDLAIHDAHAAGVGVSALARATGLSRQGVYEILRRKES